MSAATDTTIILDGLAIQPMTWEESKPYIQAATPDDLRALEVLLRRARSQQAAAARVMHTVGGPEATKRWCGALHVKSTIAATLKAARQNWAKRNQFV